MKITSITTAVVFFLTLGTAAFAQPGLEPLKPGGPKPGREPLQEVTSTTGTVGNYVYNEDYVYDGFVFKSSSSSDTIKFAPNMGTQLRNLAKEGTKVTVNAVSHITPEGRNDIHLVSLIVNGQTVMMTPPNPPATPVAATTVSETGKISKILLGKRGEVNGFMLDANTILRFPPRTAEELSQKTAVGASISFTGAIKQPNSDEAVAKQIRIIHYSTVTINGTQYLTR